MTTEDSIIADSIDILEDDLMTESSDVFRLLLKDHNTSKRKEGKETEYHSIIWATNDYAHLGEGYSFYDEIKPELITEPERGHIIQPRINKKLNQQDARSKGMAEVFTPSWMCNEQNNLVDEAWFGRKNVFNEPSSKEDDFPWVATPNPITEFPEGKTWIDYVKANRLEISCGEAPYLTSRYDTTTGVPIPIEQRIGLLDRKLRLVSENCNNSSQWLDYARVAYQSTYGYEWQGDNLLLAREALYATFVEAYEHKFHRLPQIKSKRSIARIISWNIWQMDGLRFVVPGSCHHGEHYIKKDCLGEHEEKIICFGCQNGTFTGHIGTLCLVRDWRHKKPIDTPFIQCIKCK